MPAVEFDEKKIDAISAEVDGCHLPGAAVGIAIGGRPVYRKGFGLASMELAVTLSPTTRMRIGSTSKHFACLAYMLLCEEGKAGIDDPIGSFLPELHPAAHPVTMRQLMGNIGGLRDVHDIFWQFSGRGRPSSSNDLLCLYRKLEEANAAPGSAWIYCNGGFLLVSIAIERIAGQSLEDVLRRRIFEPLGMHDSLLRRWDTDFVSNSATLHMTDTTGGFEKSYLGTALAGEGGIVSTVDDMLRWLAHMDAPAVGSAATWKVMKESQRLASGTATGYGLGLFTGTYRGIEALHHPGGVMGGNAQMLKVPAAGLDIVVMVNRHDVSAVMLVDEILNACLPGLKPRETMSKPLAAGTFRSPTTGRIVQLFAKEGRQMASIDGVDLPFESDDDGVLRPAGASRFLKQAITPIGDRQSPVSLQFNHFGNLDELASAPRVEKPDLGAIVGRYRSGETDTEMTISNTADGVRALSVGRFGSVMYRLECLADGIWRAISGHPTPRDGIFSFDSDGTVLRYSNDRIWALRFHRVHVQQSL